MSNIKQTILIGILTFIGLNVTAFVLYLTDLKTLILIEVIVIIFSIFMKTLAVITGDR